MWKTKDVKSGSSIVEKYITVFKEFSWWTGRHKRDVICTEIYKNNGKVLDYTTVVITKPSKKRVWQTVKELINIAEHIPVEIMVKDRELIIRDGITEETDLNDVRKELKSHEIQV